MKIHGTNSRRSSTSGRIRLTKVLNRARKALRIPFRRGVSPRFGRLTLFCLDSLGAPDQLSSNGCPRSPKETASALVLDCACDVRARAVRHRGRRAVRGCERGKERAVARGSVRHEHALCARRVELCGVRRASVNWPNRDYSSSTDSSHSSCWYRRERRAPSSLARPILRRITSRTSHPARALIGGRSLGPLRDITGHSPA
jgi:hypothetical protein